MGWIRFMKQGRVFNRLNDYKLLKRILLHEARKKIPRILFCSNPMKPYIVASFCEGNPLERDMWWKKEKSLSLAEIDSCLPASSHLPCGEATVTLSIPTAVWYLQNTRNYIRQPKDKTFTWRILRQRTRPLIDYQVPLSYGGRPVRLNVASDSYRSMERHAQTLLAREKHESLRDLGF